MSTEPNMLRTPIAIKALEDYVAGKTQTFAIEDASVVLEATKRMSAGLMKQSQLLSIVTNILPQVEAAASAVYNAAAGLNSKIAEHLLPKQPAGPTSEVPKDEPANGG